VYQSVESLLQRRIPSITLAGALDDWRDVRRRAASFAKYGLESWMKPLLPVLDEIEATSRRHGDREFWQSFFRYDSVSGGSTMNGWIHVLFPYLKRKDKALVRNAYKDNWPVECRKALEGAKVEWREQQGFDGPYLKQISSGLVSAPVKVSDDGQGRSHDLRFVAGMLGISLEPQSGTPGIRGARCMARPAAPHLVLYRNSRMINRIR